MTNELFVLFVDTPARRYKFRNYRDLLMKKAIIEADEGETRFAVVRKRKGERSIMLSCSKSWQWVLSVDPMSLTLKWVYPAINYVQITIFRGQS